MSFMATHAPLGISWLPFHAERVLNSVNHILNNSDFVKFGITSWLGLKDTLSNQIYAVQAHEYIHYSIIKIIVGEENFSKYGSYFDNFILIVLSGIATELNLIVLRVKNNYIPENLLAAFSFAIFLSLPFTYRMNLAPWQDVYCLLFLLWSYILFAKNKKIIALLLYLYSFLWNYHWGLFFGTTYFFIKIFSLISKRQESWKELFPPSYRGEKSSWLIIFASFFSPVVSVLQSFLLRLENYQLTNSSALFRVGIDSASNIHHGGWLAPYQFLGGVRLTLCLDNNLPTITSAIKNPLSENIFLLNCFSAILGMFILSILSIISYYFLSVNKNKFRWVLGPFAIVFLASCSVLQQSVAVHLQGRSIFFAFIFIVGIINFFISFPPLKKKSPLIPLFSSILVISFILNNIKVSYLTGPNG